MLDLINTLNSYIWSSSLIYICLGVGLFFSIKTRFVQLRLLKEMGRLLLHGKSSNKGISSFQALTLALSGRVGTGNIAGVAAAIGFGGPGAVFWMWVVAFLGAATSYIESTNAQIFKEEENGIYRGGPAYYIEKAMGQKWYAWIFAFATIIACGITGPMVQSNSISTAFEMAFGPGKMVETVAGNYSQTNFFTGLILSVLLGLVIFGGIKRIASITQYLVPFMAILYLSIALLVIGMHMELLPTLFLSIINDAFTPMAGYGAAIGWGIKRGVYSNEAGLGTGPHSAAAAEVEHPAQQGLIQAFSVYIDTLFVCSATAFIILITNSYNVQIEFTSIFREQNIAADISANGPAFTQIAIDSVFSGWGNPFIAVVLFFFAFTTLLALYFIADNNVSYLNRTFKTPFLSLLLKLLIIVTTFIGAIKVSDFAWGLGDLGIGLMAWLNIVALIAIFFTAKPAIKALNDYEKQKSMGVKLYRFNPEILGIKNANFWTKD